MPICYPQPIDLALYPASFETTVASAWSGANTRRGCDHVRDMIDRTPLDPLEGAAHADAGAGSVRASGNASR
jgi:hypothetical protein